MNYSRLSKVLIRLLAAVVCFFLFVECLLRILGFYFLSPSSRDRNITGRGHTIICIGDSFTYGLQVNRDSTYPKQLEKLLNAGKEGAPVKVYNLGIPGTNSSQHLRTFQDAIKRDGKISLLILLTGANDSWNFAKSNINRFVHSQSFLERVRYDLYIFLSELRLYKMLKVIALNLRGFSLDSEMDPFQQVLRSEKVDKDVLRNLLEYNLSETIKLAQDNNIEVVLLNYPSAGPNGGDIESRISSRFGVFFVDVHQIFKKSLKVFQKSDLLLYDCSHPNKKGNSLIAQALYEVITDHKLIGIER